MIERGMFDLLGYDGTYGGKKSLEFVRSGFHCIDYKVDSLSEANSILSVMKESLENA